MTENKSVFMKTVQGIGGIIVMLFVIALVFGPKDGEASAAPSPSDSQTLTASPTPTVSPTPQPVVTDEDSLRTAIADALDDQLTKLTFDEETGYLKVTFEVRDNLFSDSIEIGAWGDQRKMIAAIRTTAAKVGKFDVVGTFPFIDKMGNEKVQPVISASYSDAVYKANLENLPGNLIMGAADDYWVHPELVALRK